MCIEYIKCDITIATANIYININKKSASIVVYWKPIKKQIPVYVSVVLILR